MVANKPFRFSVRTLLILTTLFSVDMGFLGPLLGFFCSSVTVIIWFEIKKDYYNLSDKRILLLVIIVFHFSLLPLAWVMREALRSS